MDFVFLLFCDSVFLCFAFLCDTKMRCSYIDLVYPIWFDSISNCCFICIALFEIGEWRLRTKKMNNVLHIKWLQRLNLYLLWITRTFGQNLLLLLRLHVFTCSRDILNRFRFSVSMRYPVVLKTLFPLVPETAFVYGRPNVMKFNRM